MPLDWSQCDLIESVPGRVSGAWVLKGTRMPVQVIFENLESGSTMEEITEQFAVTREQIEDLLRFVVDSLELEPRFEEAPLHANSV